MKKYCNVIQFAKKKNIYIKKYLIVSNETDKHKSILKTVKNKTKDKCQKIQTLELKCKFLKIPCSYNNEK